MYVTPPCVDVDQLDVLTVPDLVGNTRNSTEPHFPFHISDSNFPLGSEGVPYRLDSFEIVGRCRALGVA